MHLRNLIKLYFTLGLRRGKIIEHSGRYNRIYIAYTEMHFKSMGLYMREDASNPHFSLISWRDEASRIQTAPS